MNTSGDAAEQVVRLSLEGTEVALKLTGSAAKNIAAAIYAMAKNKDKNQIRGKQRLTAMLKSGKELKVFTISEEHLKQFATEAKRYGVVYCALRGKDHSPDGMVDVMVRAEDASKINRIVERFKLSTVDAASIKTEIQQAREGRKGQKSPAETKKEGAVETKKTDGQTPGVPEQVKPEKSQEDQLLDEMLGAPARKEDPAPSNPQAAKMEKSPLSEPTLEKREKAVEGTAKKQERPSVRKELREIQSRRKQEEAAVSPVKEKEPSRSSKRTEKPVQHKQPSKKKKKPKMKAR